MSSRQLFKLNLFLGAFLISTGISFAQSNLTGVVYDMFGAKPLPAVTVLTSSGSGTFTDYAGRYEIVIFPNDSIWFSYLGKTTKKFCAKECLLLPEFNISLLVEIPVLKEVIVKPRNYKVDSIQNRIDYAKAFNFKRPTLGSIVESVSITGFVIDLDELARVFQFKKNRSMSSFRNRLLEEEKNKFIDRRFTIFLIKTITGIDESKLDAFMKRFRPSYMFTLIASDYDFREYIKKSYQEFIVQNN